MTAQNAFLLAICVLHCCGVWGLADDLLARPLDAEQMPFPGELTAVSANWQITLRTEEGKVQHAPHELLFWGERRTLPQGAYAVLIDGSLLAGDWTRLDGERLLLETGLFGEVALPMDRVRGIVLRPPAAPLDQDRLLGRLLDATGDRDRLLLANGDELEGVVAGLEMVEDAEPPNAPRGSAGMRLRMTRTGQDFATPLDMVQAVIFNPALAARPGNRPARMLWGLRDGDFLKVSQLELEQGRAALTLVSGQRLALDAQLLWNETIFLQPQTSEVTFLSDIKPISYKHVSFLTVSWPYHLDRSAAGGLLRYKDQIYSHGVGMHSAARLAWRLPEGFTRFEAEAALDALAHNRGSVIYRVFLADSQGAFRKAYESGVVRGGDAPTHISVDLGNAAAMALLVDFADRGDERDLANWLNARLIRDSR